jgi:hypothetical protein
MSNGRPDFIPSRRPGEIPAADAATCRSTWPFKDKPTRLAVQIDFRVAGKKLDVVYDVQRIPAALCLLGRDHPDAYAIEAKLKEVPVTDLQP